MMYHVARGLAEKINEHSLQNIHHLFGLSTRFTFKLAPTANVLAINTADDAWQMRWVGAIEGISLPTLVYPNFEDAAQRWDAIYLSRDGERATRFGDPSLYGRDCETLFVRRPSVVVPRADEVSSAHAKAWIFPGLHICPRHRGNHPHDIFYVARQAERHRGSHTAIPAVERLGETAEHGSSRVTVVERCVARSDTYDRQ